MPLLHRGLEVSLYSIAVIASFVFFVVSTLETRKASRLWEEARGGAAAGNIDHLLKGKWRAERNWWIGAMR